MAPKEELKKEIPPKKIEKLQSQRKKMIQKPPGRNFTLKCTL